MRPNDKLRKGNSGINESVFAVHVDYVEEDNIVILGLVDVQRDEEHFVALQKENIDNIVKNLLFYKEQIK